MIEQLKEVYNYRTMLMNLVKKDLRTRYKGSVLGFLWTFVNPLLQLAVYSIVFSTVLRMNVEKYPMFLFVGIVPWIFFATSVQVSAGSLINNKDLIKKVYFPRIIIPIAVVFSGLMNLIFSFVIVFPALLIWGIKLNLSVLYLPIIIMIQFLLTMGFSVLFACLNVYFRDLEHILGILIMAWFYLTPIIFPIEMIPQKYFGIFFINPMTSIVTAYKKVLYYGTAPDIRILAISFIVGVLLLIFSFNIFKKLQRNFAEEI